MKLLKFLIAVIVSAIIVTNITPAGAFASAGVPQTGGAAADALISEPAAGVPISESAAICRDIGILLGGADGVNYKYLSDFTTRLQAVHITVRLLGAEGAATSYDPSKTTPEYDLTGIYPVYGWPGIDITAHGPEENPKAPEDAQSFADAELVEYEKGRNLLAYVKAHPELGWQGDQAGNINPDGYMTSQAMYKVLLSGLGYSCGEDFAWEDTVAFAGGKGLRAMASKRGFLTNNDVAVMLVEALKTRMKDSQTTLCEYLAYVSVIDEDAAYAAAMLPGSPGFTPPLTYNEGGPLLRNVVVDADQRRISVRFNTALNPTYAKALRNYNYYMPGTGYLPISGKCQTSMADEYTVVIQFPREGWVVIDGTEGTDAFYSYIASGRKNELRVNGLFDVDGAPLPELYIDVPAV